MQEAVCDPFGALKLDAVESDEEAVVEAQEGTQGSVVVKGVEAEWEEGIEGIPYTLPISKHRSNR